MQKREVIKFKKERDIKAEETIFLVSCAIITAIAIAVSSYSAKESVYLLLVLIQPLLLLYYSFWQGKAVYSILSLIIAASLFVYPIMIMDSAGTYFFAAHFGKINPKYAGADPVDSLAVGIMFIASSVMNLVVSVFLYMLSGLPFYNRLTKPDSYMLMKKAAVASAVILFIAAIIFLLQNTISDFLIASKLENIGGFLRDALN